MTITPVGAFDRTPGGAILMDGNRLRDETVKVLRATDIAGTDHVIAGQYEGYLEEPNV